MGEKLTVLEQAIYKKRENIVARKVADKWRCDYGSMGKYSPFDIYFLRDKVIIGIAEIRTRNESFDAHPNVMIDVDKWFPLIHAEVGLGLKAFYIIAFYEGIYGARIGDLPVNTFQIRYAGRNDRPAFANDSCPVIVAPRSAFKLIDDAEGVYADEAHADGTV